jgi:polar amino acid transport system substrate-binding protein
VELVLTDMAWEEHLAALAIGTADIAAGATYSAERDRYAYFSKPYRRETDVLVLRKGASSRYRFRGVEEMLDRFTALHFRLGVIADTLMPTSRSTTSLPIRLAATCW